MTSFRNANDRIERLRTKPEIAESLRTFAAEREAAGAAQREATGERCRPADESES